ncbi:hypothetical protein LOZ80_25255 [Paenibacillus sp. HWE-109]|uniref:hypothetical protein n=1 Tax=Paenibacillus sp. HWE-109 TaxID=1306526 RepID=UPI001EDDCF5F|nr:hypothetical protein [Paenibacillus sp. HWE-109]UKS24897.1 hypothetical protein LOZ80_25255 [Paenibacillus sp. HWE-109]
MAVESRETLSLIEPFKGKLNIIRIRNQLINSKFTIIDIFELEKYHFIFTSSLCLPTNHEVTYGFEFALFNQTIQVVGEIKLVNNNDNEYVYKAIIKTDEETSTEASSFINHLAATQNKKYEKLIKSYTQDNYLSENTLDLIC